MDDFARDELDVYEIVSDAIGDVELEPEESAAILSYVNRETPALLSPETSYFVLGSYRGEYLRRLRIVENELNKRLKSYAFLLGDLEDIGLDRLPSFRIEFAVLATYSDYIVGVYEQDAGGEVTELGKISEPPFYTKSHVMPRDYAWMTDRRLETEADVVAACTNVYYNDDLSPEEVESEIDSIVTMAQVAGVEITHEEVVNRIEERAEGENEAVDYSWVHLNEFRFFELHGRCYPWTTVDELRERVSEIP